MPFVDADAVRHNGALKDKPEARRQWVAVANSVLKKCMADGGTDETCAPKAIRQANGVVQSNSLAYHRGPSPNYTVREEMHQGRKYLVVPVVMMTQGVHRGSHGPILHLAEELGRFPGAWDGIPVCVNHPHDGQGNIPANSPDVLDEWSVGRVFHTMMDGQKLRAEAWLDLEALARVSPEALEYITLGKPLDVSVGVFTDEDMAAGDYEGEHYEAVARNHRPEHLALLPGGTGACSWNDGCGVRTHEDGGKQMEKDKTTTSEVMQGLTDIVLKELAMEGINLQVNEMGYRELSQVIQAKLDRMDDDVKSHYLEDCFDGYIIYRVDSKGSGPRNLGEGNLFKRNYTVGQDGAVEFTGEAQPVIKRVSYDPASQQREVYSMSKQKEPCCEAKVQMLIETGLYAETDRDRLLAMEEADIEILAASADDKSKLQAKIDEMATKMKEMKDKMATMETNSAQAGTDAQKELQVLKESLGDQDKLMAILPAETRSVIGHSLRLYQAERDRKIAHVLASQATEVYTREMLAAMDDQGLDALARAIKAPADYSGLAPTPPNTPKTYGAKPYMPPEVTN